MGSAVKKPARPNDEPPIVSPPAQDDQSGKIATLQDDDSRQQPAEAAAVQPITPAKAPNRSSWYTGGSWRSKASPVAQVARESISVDKGVSSESSSQEDTKSRPGQSLSKGVKGSRKSVPLVAEATRIHATSDASDKSRLAKAKFPNDEKQKDPEAPTAEETKPPVEPEAAESKEVIQPSEDTAAETRGDTENNDDGTASSRPASAAWLSWWSRPDGYGSDTDKVKREAKLSTDETTTRPTEQAVQDEQTSPAAPKSTMTNDTASQRLKSEINANAKSARSWFGLWSTAQNQQAAEDEERRENAEQRQPPEVSTNAKEETSKASEKGSKPNQKAEDTASKPGEDRPKASGWAFWSTERAEESAAPSGDTQKQVGELAVADTPSQSHPEAAQYNEQRKESKTESKVDVKRASSLLRLKRGRVGPVKDASDDTPATSSPEGPPTQPAVESTDPSPIAVQARKRLQQTRPNLILPSVRDTYPLAPNPSALERLTQYVAQSLHLPGSEAPPAAKHPFISAAPTKVKKAIAIGVHGFFPTPLIQRVIGQPTGTSIRFANSAASAIKQWCHDHQPDVKNVEIEKVALEGEGYIADRVATLWKLLLNWLSHLRQAEFILVACHSQGVPVAIMLIAKLIQLGALSQNVRIGICAMAGINLGPFVEYKSRLFGGIALELFDFCESKSKVSVAYLDSLDVCLRNGVRVTFVGSMDDQLVSLESSLHAPLTHPYVNRAVFIDGRLHTPNFLTHLIAFAIKLRNLGANDHGLIREVSAALAGSLVGGEGHSRLYDDPAVYNMAIEFALESTNMDSPPKNPATPLNATDEAKAREAAAQRRASLSSYPNTTAAANSMRRGSLTSLSLSLPGIPPVVASYETPGAVGSVEKNPYVLPWAVRGMLAEECVKKDLKLQEEVKELVKEFEDWRPTSKVLRDVRWRLEGVRSML